MSLNFGLVLLPSAPARLTVSARVAEAASFDLIGLGDSQIVAREVYSSLAAVAMATERVRLGPTVTNLETRHPAITAGAIATIDELSGGRAFLGLGSGDSSVYSLGSRATSVARLRDGTVALRKLISGERAEWDGNEIHLRWAGRSTLPVWISAEGPRTLRAAGELADGVIIGGGVDDESLHAAMSAVHAGASERGRSRSDLEVWSFVKLGLGPTRKEALRPLKVSLAAGANHAFRHGFEGKNVPAQLIPRIEALRSAYAYRDHDQHDGSNVDLVDRFGLTDWLADRFAVAGTAEDCIRGLERIAASGVDGVLITALLEDPDSFIEEFGRTVLEPFRARERESTPHTEEN